MREGRLFNTAYLFTPGGEVHTQDKLQIQCSVTHICRMHAGP
jgi:hypothetical protein